MQELYIGLMSGTSLDGVDAVVVDFSQDFKVLGHASIPFESALKEDLLLLNSPSDNEIHRASLIANQLAISYAKLCLELLTQLGLKTSQIRAIGAHGQTIRHRPGAFDGIGYTVQLNNPALLAELTGITVCAEFRTRDVAAGGQGAPLVPAFHKNLFSREDRSVCILNLGGISNLSLLPPTGSVQPYGVRGEHPTEVIGFDCGPANCLMDEWCKIHTNKDFDESGDWASGGQAIDPLLNLLLKEDYFHAPAPKSTGRDLFNMQWLAKHLNQFKSDQEHSVQQNALEQNTNRPIDLALSPQDIQATLAALTAKSCALSIQSIAPGLVELIVCGGGALNTHLMDLLSKHLPGVDVVSSAAHGLPPLQVEASAFAWLAKQCLRGETASLKSVTGAQGARILGAIYQA